MAGNTPRKQRRVEDLNRELATRLFEIPEGEIAPDYCWSAAHIPAIVEALWSRGISAKMVFYGDCTSSRSRQHVTVSVYQEPPIASRYAWWRCDLDTDDPGSLPAVFVAAVLDGLDIWDDLEDEDEEENEEDDDR